MPLAKRRTKMADEPEGSATAVAEVAPPAEGQETAEPKAEVEQPAETLESLAAKLQERDAALAKLEQQLRSTQGVAKGRLDTDAKVERLARETALTRQMIEAFVKRQAAGTPEQVEADIEKIQQSAQQETVQTAAQERANQIWGRIIREVEDAGIEVRLPNGRWDFTALEQAAEWQEANAMWNEGYANGDPAKMNFRLMEAAHDAAAGLRRAAQVKAFETTEAENRRKSGELRTPAIRAGAGGGIDYQKRLRSGEALPSSEDIDRLTARFVSGR